MNLIFQMNVLFVIMSLEFLNTMPRLTYRVCTEDFGKLSKDRYFSRLHNDTAKKIFEHRQGKLVFHFSVVTKK